ncbi:MAG: VWA domain-containing protein [Alphaproteobacteria bacterium]|nr:VWA domain-containing protein [Alphaproteobacteria bacterium]
MKPKPEIETRKLTEIVFILDRSGSMEVLTQDTIGGFNSMIEKQKDKKVNTLVSTVLFDNEAVVLHDRVKIADIPAMTSKEYWARGTTALYDAIGSSIKHISNIHKYAREEDVPTKTMFVITTDGFENASKIYTRDKVKKMIEEHKENHSWEFIFLGADIDAIGAAREIGIDEDHAVEYKKDSQGTKILYQTVSECCCCEELPKNWKQSLEADLERRKDK